MAAAGFIQVSWPDFFTDMIQSRFLNAILSYCEQIGWDSTWFMVDISLLIPGLVTNIVLLWILLREWKPLSGSQVLGVNIAVMDLAYLSILPIGLTLNSESESRKNKTQQEFSAAEWKDDNTANSPLDSAKDGFVMFNLIGCPLLLSCMCIERVVAVMKPVLYLKMRKRAYRLAISAVVWLITLCFCVASGIMNDMTFMMIPVSITISCLFILMIACLCGIMRSLMQQSPAHTTFANHVPSESPQKRRAVYNVLAVVVPAVISYLPVLPLVPLVVYLQYCNRALSLEMCNVFELSKMFPRFGVFIGPLFYLSRARQMCCHGNHQPSQGK